MIDNIQIVCTVFKKNVTAFAVGIIDQKIKEHDWPEQFLIFICKIEVMIFNIIADVLLKWTAPMRAVFAQDRDGDNVQAELFAQ